MDTIIRELEQQRDSIERALEALREITGSTAGAVATKRRGRPPGTKQAGSAVAVNRRSEGQRRRWAEKRAQQAGPQKGGGGLTEEGRRRLSELMKARWASKNPPQAKKAGAKRKR